MAVADHSAHAGGDRGGVLVDIWIRLTDWIDLAHGFLVSMGLF